MLLSSSSAARWRCERACTCGLWALLLRRGARARRLHLGGRVLTVPMYDGEGFSR